MKNQILKKSLFVCFFLLFVAAFVSAAEKETETNGKPTDLQVKGIEEEAKTLVNAEKNMTYGRCVSELTKIRSECFVAAKTASKTCITNANKEAAKVKECKKTYKTEQAVCKDVFKEAKIVCKQFKKTFGDKLKFWQ